MVDLKELKKLVKYLRKEGITEFKQGDLEFKLTPKEPKISRKRVDVDPIEAAIETDYPTQEELLYFSSGGIPTEGN